MFPALASAHSEGTEPADPSSAPALLAFGGATTRYTALTTELGQWRQIRVAPSGHSASGEHTAHGAHAGHAMPVEVRKPPADAHVHH